ncbi:unnamed protein product [Allacma fusca]|uniref:Uncharacterized protein n=1 Tax=Allacma fusca TaxID=39272 RepID=A0A8J2LJZ8_9HEXA|nr:unnamed protein product [Allacma fusca]
MFELRCGECKANSAVCQSLVCGFKLDLTVVVKTFPIKTLACLRSVCCPDMKWCRFLMYGKPGVVIATGMTVYVCTRVWDGMEPNPCPSKLCRWVVSEYVSMEVQCAYVSSKDEGS